MTRYECRKCGTQFKEPYLSKNGYENMHVILTAVCPTCRHPDIVLIFCATCDFYKTRLVPCEMGHRTVVPYNVSCDQWKIRSKNKPKVV